MPHPTDHSEAASPISYWYCLRTQTKREHIASSILATVEEVEVFCPRISQVKKTRAGKKRFVEAMFPGYLFAKFNYVEKYRQVMHSQAVIHIVEHGGRRVVPEGVINELRQSLPEGVIVAPDPSLEAGAKIEFVSGSLKGLNAKVLAQLSSGLRVQVLLDILGREIQIEADASDIMLAPEPES